jgi:hypothetical protein
MGKRTSHTIELDINIRCDTCGDDLVVTMSTYGTADNNMVIVPCEKCLTAAKDEAREEGFEAGKDASEVPE